MAYTEIQLFVKEALEKKVKRSEIRTRLLAAHWSEQDVKDALRSFDDVDFVVPVPTHAPYLSAREGFGYLTLFLALYISAYSFGGLIYTFINRAYPDVLETYATATALAASARNYTASLVIAFPVYLFLTFLFERALAKDPRRRSSKVRKWLTYSTLFVMSAIVIGDLIALVQRFLAGGLTTRFELKVLTILVICCTIFGYYLYDLQKEEKE